MAVPPDHLGNPEEIEDRRCRICFESVRKEEFTVAPPTRMELLEALSGIRASDLRTGLLLVATDAFSAPPDSNMPTIWQVLFSLRKAHWARSVYLLTEVETGPEGLVRPGDCIKGVNLTREVDMAGSEAFYTSNARDVVETVVPQPPPYQISCHIGGPVQPTVPLATYMTSTDTGSAGDSSGLSLVAAAGGQRLWLGRLGPVLEFANLDAENAPASGQQGVVKIYCGHAVWNRSQLMGEIARGSWGILEAYGLYLTALGARPAAPQAEAENSADAAQENSSSLWERAVAGGSVRYATHNPLAEEFGRRRLEATAMVAAAVVAAAGQEET